MKTSKSDIWRRRRDRGFEVESERGRDEMKVAPAAAAAAVAFINQPGFAQGEHMQQIPKIPLVADSLRHAVGSAKERQVERERRSALAGLSSPKLARKGGLNIFVLKSIG